MNLSDVIFNDMEHRSAPVRQLSFFCYNVLVRQVKVIVFNLGATEVDEKWKTMSRLRR